MITFYATTGCHECEQIEDSLKQLSLAHKLVWIENGGPSPEELGPNPRVPAMLDEHECITGHFEIMQHVDKLARFETQWYKYQSEVCYVDDDQSFWQ